MVELKQECSLRALLGLLLLAFHLCESLPRRDSTWPSVLLLERSVLGSATSQVHRSKALYLPDGCTGPTVPVGDLLLSSLELSFGPPMGPKLVEGLVERRQSQILQTSLLHLSL